MPKCEFNKVAGNFMEIVLWYGCCLINLLDIFRTPFPKNTSGELFLSIVTGESLIKIVNVFSHLQNM